MKKIFLIALILISAITNEVAAQKKSNLEQVFALVDKSAESILTNSAINKFTFVFNSPDEYKLLEPRALKNFGGKIDNSSDTALVYTITNVRVDYGEMFRDWFLGDFKMHRSINLTGDYLLKGNGKIILSDSFSESVEDTVYYAEINRLENNSLPFTKGELPEEPFFSGLLEPVVAVSSIVVAVYLLFTVRSK